MASMGRREEFLRRAKEAEKEAEKSKEPKIRAEWLRIANGYMQLAEFASQRHRLA